MKTTSKGIIFICEHCKATLKASYRLAGKEKVCPNCKQRIIIPEESIDEK
jgi:DNA-directed RNA polymerase subunit RPC12/RpoP